jgi:hypothetical protein
MPTEDKYRPIVISTTRGMGKTFILKKIGKHDLGENYNIQPIKEAGEYGRIISMDCDYFWQNIADSGINRRYYWNVIIVYHILHLFKGSSMNGINFSQSGLNFIIQQLQISTSDTLGSWVKRFISYSTEDAFQQLIVLTKNAFGCSSNAKPVILLDNAHVLAKKVTNVESTKQKNHTLLSLMLTDLCNYRPICLVAGTTDGNLNMLIDFSSFIPAPLHLTPFSMEDADILGQAIVRTLNLNNQKNVIWPGEEDYTILTMVYETCQIPRLLKFAIMEWYSGMINENTKPFILEAFWTKAEQYYSDALEGLRSLDTRDLALLLLCCGVYFPIQENDCFPGTELLPKILIEEAVIFPYFGDTYVIPSFYWKRIEKQQNQKFQTVNQIVHQLIPNIQLSNLTIPLKRYLEEVNNDDDLGSMWETIVASSLVVKYKLLCIKLNITDTLLYLSSIIDIDPKAQAYKIIQKFQVNFSEGLILVNTEVSCKSKFRKAVLLNSKHHQAHYDFIICSQPFNIACQCKSAINDPEGNIIAKQLDEEVTLLWFYPGMYEDKIEVPKFYKELTVVKAINENRIGFLNGAGFVQSLAIDLIRLLKTVYKKRRIPNMNI